MSAPFSLTLDILNYDTIVIMKHTQKSEIQEYVNVLFSYYPYYISSDEY